MSFQEKVVIVTGSSSGIGAAIAIKFAEEGAKVAIVGRNTEKLNNVAKKCNTPLVLVADVSKDVDVKRILDETLKRFGKLDILVNNAGIARSATIQAENAMAAFDEVMSTNLRSVVYLTHLAAPHLVKTKGNIINISSVAALKVLGEASFTYNTSKAGLDHFTRSIAQELASSGVRANIVSPGPVKTDFAENNMGITVAAEEAFFEKVQSMTALNRFSIAEDIADLVLFLVSDKVRAITGSTFVSDNGIWHTQVARVSQKVTGTLRALYRLKKILPSDTKIMLEQSLIFPIFDYGDVCYFDLNADLLDKHDRFLSYCIRFVFHLRKYDHVSEHRSLLKWLPIRQRREQRALTTLFSFCKIR